MKKYLFAYAVLATALLFFTCRHYRAENRRLVENQTALAADVTRYRTRLGAEAASVQALRLRCGEFETLRAAESRPMRQIVSDGHGFGLKAPEGVAVVERHPCREQTFRAVGVQFDAHEARHARRIAFRGGERLDTLREPLCGGGVGASEQFARRGVEHGDVSGDVARAAPGQMHGLV